MPAFGDLLGGALGGVFSGLNDYYQEQKKIKRDDEDKRYNTAAEVFQSVLKDPNSSDEAKALAGGNLATLLGVQKSQAPHMVGQFTRELTDLQKQQAEEKDKYLQSIGGAGYAGMPSRFRDPIIASLLGNKVSWEGGANQREYERSKLEESRAYQERRDLEKRNDEIAMKQWEINHAPMSIANMERVENGRLYSDMVGVNPYTGEFRSLNKSDITNKNSLAGYQYGSRAADDPRTAMYRFNDDVEGVMNRVARSVNALSSGDMQYNPQGKVLIANNLRTAIAELQELARSYSSVSRGVDWNMLINSRIAELQTYLDTVQPRSGGYVGTGEQMGGPPPSTGTSTGVQQPKTQQPGTIAGSLGMESGKNPLGLGTSRAATMQQQQYNQFMANR